VELKFNQRCLFDYLSYHTFPSLWVIEPVSQSRTLDSEPKEIFSRRIVVIK
jgi:hypothetical protein